MGGSCLKEKKHIKCGHFLKREGILMVAGMAKIPLLVGTFAFYMERLPWIKLFFGLKFFPNLQVFSLKLIVPKRYPLMPQFPRCKNGKKYFQINISYYKFCHPTLTSTQTKYNYKIKKALYIAQSSLRSLAMTPLHNIALQNISPLIKIHVFEILDN